MVQTVTAYCVRIIEYLFYALFFFVPLAFTSTTSELFEFNKMWLTFGITWIIAATWITKMVLQKRFFIQKTPLDIPIALFLLAHIISTIFSIDQHISLWGYYSRFNGGLFSIITYIFLYYAFVSNVIDKETSNTIVRRTLIVSLAAGAVVALWGFPSHFGYDPTCLVFRGTFDVSCWTEAFQPKIRIFSTLGQPNWLAAYLAIFLPLTLAYGLIKFQISNFKFQITQKNVLFSIGYFLLAVLFYIDILYTGSQSGFVGAVIAIGLFAAGYIYLHRQQKLFATKIAGSIIAACILMAFVIGQPIVQFSQFSLANLQKTMTSTPTGTTPSRVQPAQAGTALEGGSGGTNSGTIRQNVWTGAINAWKDNPLFGTGVETFAFAYYKYRPAAHNMTSEWDYLYNKAHNEYLNYLATTGIFGLGAYLLLIGVFVWTATKSILQKHTEHDAEKIINLALLTGYISILISNFFGFSVVIVNIYLFIIPAFVFILSDKITFGRSITQSLVKTMDPSPINSQKPTTITSIQWIIAGIIWVIALFQIWTLINFWYADQAFALAQNYNRIGQYNEGASKIREAITLRGDEPVFAEELITSDAIIAVALMQQKQTEKATQFLNEAVQTGNQLTTTYPNNINFLKSSVRVFYTLSQLNPQYLQQALEIMKRTAIIAPTDAKISYNLGVLYGQNNQTQKGIDTLQKTIQLKPDYRDAYFALGLFYHDLAVDKDGNVVKPDMQKKAVETMQYVLTRFGKNDKAVLDTLKSWK